jgi:membrane associated rhomboid family serine protease
MARYNRPLDMRVSAVKFLIAANVVVFLLQSASPDAMEALFALRPLQPDGGPPFRPWQLITYAFLHDTQHIAHLLFNMWGLWMFGAEIERYVGPRRLLTCYFA